MMNEEELNALIEQVESQEMLRAPKHLKEDVMAQIRRDRQKAARKQLFLYRMKVVAAMAAALTLLILMPDDSAESFDKSSAVRQAGREMEQMALERQQDVQDSWEKYYAARQNHGIKELFGNISSKIAELTGTDSTEKNDVSADDMGADREEDHAEKEK